jgi:acyl-CoA dehydrogenase
MVLSAAWTIDRHGFHQAQEEVSLIKFYVAGVMTDVVDKAIQVHGALGLTDDTILAYYYAHERGARIYDGPDEVHKVTVARQVLKGYVPADVPSEHVPTRRGAAQKKFADLVVEVSAND